MVFDAIQTFLLVVPATIFAVAKTILAVASLVQARGSARSEIIIAEATARAFRSRRLK